MSFFLLWNIKENILKNVGHQTSIYFCSFFFWGGGGGDYGGQHGTEKYFCVCVQKKTYTDLEHRFG